jgi:hypothetical protein
MAIYLIFCKFGEILVFIEFLSCQISKNHSIKKIQILAPVAAVAKNIDGC